MSQPDRAAELDDGPAPSGSALPTQPAFAAPTASQILPPGGAAGTKLPWKAASDGKAVFRRGTPLVLWWAWVAFVIFNIVDVAIPEHDYFSLELTTGLLAVTAVVYACALRPRVVADNDAVHVYNPYRDHVARWSGVNGVHLGDSVELTCARADPKKDKVIYCWALYSGRRSRLRSQLRAERQQARLLGRTAAEGVDLRRPDPVNLMAAELGRRSTSARQRGAEPEPDLLASRWALLPAVYLLVSALALLVLIVAR
jgi:Bacterial PH domain